MELLGGLGLLGTYLKGEKVAKTPDKKLLHSTAQNNKTFNNQQVKEVEHHAQKLAAKRYKQMKHTEKTNVIPPMFNQQTKSPKLSMNRENQLEAFSDSDSDFSDDKLSNSASYESSESSNDNSVDIKDPMCFMNRCEKMMDNRKHERKLTEKAVDNNNFLSQFDDLRFNNPDKPVSSNAVDNQTGHGAGASRFETERRLALQGGFSNFESDNDMSFNVVSKDDQKNFNNTLKPFFGRGKGYGSDRFHEQQMYDQNQRKLEMFTGSIDNLEFRPKEERKPLFNPVFGLTNMYGTPVMTDVFERRYEPSKERRNETPFEATKVTPGLGLGSNAVATFGYHDPFRVLPKTVDELRTANNPKITYGTVIIPGLKGSRAPVPSKVFKRRPLTYREYGPEWMIKGVGDYRAASLSGEINPKNMATVNRGVDDTPQIGPAQYAKPLPTPESLIEKSREPNRENYMHADPRNYARQEGKKEYAADWYDVSKNTQRSMKTDRAGAGMGNSPFDKNKLFDPTDTQKMTLRELHSKYDRAGAAMGNSPFDKLPTVDFTDVANMTQREIYSKTDRAAAGHGNSQFDRSPAEDFTDVQKMTQREVYSKTDRAGAGHGNSQFDKTPAVDFTDVQKMTQREVYSKADRAGAGLGNAQFDKNKAVDFTDVQKMTQREIHSKTDRAGAGHGNAQFDKNKAVDFTDVQKMTQREIHSKTDRAGVAGNGQFNRAPAEDFTDVSKMTQREIYSKTDRAGKGIGNSQFDKQTAVDWNDVQKMTQREIYSKIDRAGVMGSNNAQFEKTRTRLDANNMNANISKENIARGREPTTCNYNKGPIIDYTVVQMCDSLQINRDLYPEPRDIAQKRMPMKYTRFPQRAPTEEWRFYSYVDQNLQGNPFINNIVHQSAAE